VSSFIPLTYVEVEPNTVNDIESSPLLTLRLIQQLKDCGKRFKSADSTGVKLSGIDLLIRTLALRSYLLREVLGADEKYVGVFLPPTVPAVAANFALALADRVAVNLNYTVSSSVLRKCSETAGLKHVLTSRKFMDKVNLDVGAPPIFLEDIRSKITVGDKLFAFLDAKLRSPQGLHRKLGLEHKKHSDTLTVIFTSGSTGVPKGVVLSGGNVTSNVEAIDEAIHLNERDVVLGILPFFHSFGYTVTLWSAMSLPCACVYHYSPLEARPIGKLAHDYGATVLLATPTFLRNYIRRIEPEQFKSLEVIVLGAEKMPIALADDFEKKFGVRPVEGYGTTELSPLVSVNIPPTRDFRHEGVWLREGTVGKTMKRFEARVVSPDTDRVLGIGEQGLLEIRGPNVMQGYLNQPEMTAEVMHDGWYRTGDVAKLDAEGFIEITGRLSRFSKIGGEMVPHIQIEEAMADILGMDEEGKLRVAVTAVPDERRGERLIVLHTPLPMPKSQLLQKLAQSGLPNIYLPGEDSFLEVEEIPVLGSGKLDLKRLREMALSHFASQS
jgi:acyl-[acyl-carrier-protein]-phospholipid O-acyltransferase / long-chain-fatty-acid--[acyl-carrier-protein] ligase